MDASALNGVLTTSSRCPTLLVGTSIPSSRRCDWSRMAKFHLESRSHLPGWDIKTVTSPFERFRRLQRHISKT